MARHALLLLAAALVARAGCNTIHGFGKDLEAAGAAIQKKSR
jgi:predicted small secreted protein